jgi:hypothetical protein
VADWPPAALFCGLFFDIGTNLVPGNGGSDLDFAWSRMSRMRDAVPTAGGAELPKLRNEPNYLA